MENGRLAREKLFFGVSSTSRQLALKQCCSRPSFVGQGCHQNGGTLHATPTPVWRAGAGVWQAKSRLPVRVL